MFCKFKWNISLAATWHERWGEMLKYAVPTSTGILRMCQNDDGAANACENKRSGSFWLYSFDKRVYQTSSSHTVPGRITVKTVFAKIVYSMTSAINFRHENFYSCFPFDLFYLHIGAGESSESYERVTDEDGDGSEQKKWEITTVILNQLQTDLSLTKPSLSFIFFSVLARFGSWRSTDKIYRLLGTIY